MKKKPKQLPRPHGAGTVSQRLQAGLNEAAALMARKRWTQARETLESLQQRYPRRPEVLAALLDLYRAVDDMRAFQATAEQLLQERAHDPELLLALSAAYMTNVRPALAFRTARLFLDRWPDHERAAEVRKLADDLESKLPELLAGTGLAGEDGLELAALHEEIQSLLEQHALAEAQRTAARLLERRPEFTPALNNLSQVYFLQGNREQAVETARRVLVLDPANYHALSNLTRYLCLGGQLDQARQVADQLKAVESTAPDLWAKKAEALAILGQDQAIFEILAQARQAGYFSSRLVDPVFYHLAAVSSLRLGDERQARQYWKQALKIAPGLDVARANVADLRQPVGQRHAPWAFDLANWLHPRVLDDLLGLLRGQKSDAQVTRAARRFLDQHPEVAALLPVLLDRGDAAGREFAVRLATMAETPETLAALRDFALGQRGPDALRQQAARTASGAGLLPPGPVRLWVSGKWLDILLVDFELHGEAMGDHSRRVEQYLVDALAALRDGDGGRAVDLLQQALEVEPDAPDLLNNLAVAYGRQGRVQEAEALTLQIIDRFPDYVFARADLARLHLTRGEVDQADAVLKPLLSRKRFHFQEFETFCLANIEVLLAQSRPESARSWLDMWASVDPEHPAIAYWRRLVGKGKGKFFR